MTFEDILALLKFFFFFLNFNSSYTCIDVKLSIPVLVYMHLQHVLCLSIPVLVYMMHLQHVLCFIHNFMGWVKFSVKH